MDLGSKNTEKARVPLHCRVAHRTLEVIDKSYSGGHIGIKIDHAIDDLVRIRTKREQIEGFLSDPAACELKSVTVARVLNCSTSLVDIVRMDLYRRACTQTQATHDYPEI